MRVLIIGGLVAAGLVALFVWALNPAVEPTSISGSGETTRSRADGEAESGLERRSVLDEARRREAEVDAPKESQPSAEPERVEPPTGRLTEKSPLTGLEVTSMSPGDLRQRGVPERYESGVVVTRVEPDSPADEVRLVPGDIIVEARMRSVSDSSDLESIVGGHTHARVTFVRDGTVLQVVLQRPFEVN